MASLMHSYRRFRFLVRSVRWVELAVSALIVIGAQKVGELDFALTPVLIVFGLGFVWNWAFWYAGRRHLLGGHDTFQFGEHELGQGGHAAHSSRTIGLRA